MTGLDLVDASVLDSGVVALEYRLDGAKAGDDADGR